jgi:large repetitive protein
MRPYGDLPRGAFFTTLRFRVQVDAGCRSGPPSPTPEVRWNEPTLTAEASVSIDIGGVPGSAILNGHAWHDANFDNLHDSGETNLAGWTVELYRNNVQLGSVTTDAGGLYRFSGLAPSATDADKYELRFSAPGATSTTAKLGLADSVFTNGHAAISAIEAGPAATCRT